MLTGLPALGILLGELVGAGPLHVLRSGVLGQVLVVSGVGLSAAGAAWARAVLAVGGAAMTSEPLAVLVLAAALLTVHGEPGSGRLHDLCADRPDPARRGSRAPAATTVASETIGWLGGVGLGLLVWALTGRRAGRRLAAGIGGSGFRWSSAGSPQAPAHADDPVELAAAWAELAVCLEGGLPVAAAVAAAAASLDGSTGLALRRVAGLLELGADRRRRGARSGRSCGRRVRPHRGPLGRHGRRTRPYRARREHPGRARRSPTSPRRARSVPVS